MAFNLPHFQNTLATRPPTATTGAPTPAAAAPAPAHTVAPGGNPNFGPIQTGAAGAYPVGGSGQYGNQPVPQPPQQNYQAPTPQAPGAAYAPGTMPTSAGSSGGAQTLPGTPAILAAAPSPSQSFGNIAQVNPAQVAASYMNPAFAGAAAVNPADAQAYTQQYENALYQALQPGFFQQNLQLQGDLASRGIQDSSAASYLMGNLGGQQASALASGIEPIIGQGFGYAQQDVTQNAANQQQSILANQAAANTAGNYNATAANEASGANANAINNAAYYNAGQYTNTVNNSEQLYNQFLNELFSSGNNLSNSLLTGLLGSYGVQTGVTNAMAQTPALQQSAYNSAYGGASNAAAGFGSGLASMIPLFAGG